jgi:antagonist of KipI
MDLGSHGLANVLVGNPDDAATLEITLRGPDLEFGSEALFAVTGAEFDLRLDETAVPMNTVWRAPAGARLRFGTRHRGARAYLGVAGGIDVPPVLGSRSSHLPALGGGLTGRPLTIGDRLPIGRSRPGQTAAGRTMPPLFPIPDGGARLRVVLGPQESYFTARALTTLRTARYHITGQSNRMGYRLEGPTLEHAGSPDTISDATPPGAVQVPASGHPILLTADRQTTGGYPKIATVITADLAVAGQLAPGNWIEFTVCDREEALDALRAQRRRLTAAG